FAVARVLEDMAVVEEPGGRLFGAGAEFGDMTVAVVEEGVGVGAADERAEDHALLVPRHGVAGAVGVGPRRAGRCLHEAVGMDEIIRIEQVHRRVGDLQVFGGAGAVGGAVTVRVADPDGGVPDGGVLGDELGAIGEVAADVALFAAPLVVGRIVLPDRVDVAGPHHLGRVADRNDLVAKLDQFIEESAVTGDVEHVAAGFHGVAAVAIGVIVAAVAVAGHEGGD